MCRPWELDTFDVSWRIPLGSPFLAKSEEVSERSLSRNDVDLHVDAVEQLLSSFPSVDNNGKVQIIVVVSLPGADRGRRKEDGLALAWVLAPQDMVSSSGR